MATITPGLANGAKCSNSGAQATPHIAPGQRPVFPVTAKFNSVRAKLHVLRADDTLGNSQSLRPSRAASKTHQRSTKQPEIALTNTLCTAGITGNTCKGRFH